MSTKKLIRVGLLDAVAIGATGLTKRAQLQSAVQGNHLGENFEHLLGHSLVVYRNQILGLGVDLEGLVEGESGLDVIGA